MEFIDKYQFLSQKSSYSTIIQNSSRADVQEELSSIPEFIIDLIDKICNN
jgi:hypothetical protein